MDWKQLHWVAQCPDLNIIENVWSQLKHALAKYPKLPSGVEDLKERVFKEWYKIKTPYIQKLVYSMTKRCQLVIKNQGYPINF